MKEIIQDRLKKLRLEMKKNGIDYYMIPTADFHNSEYVNDYFKVREYFSGFTGSNGTLIVWQDGAGLWTDGRYFIQAENELAGTTIQLFKMQNEGVPTIDEFLEKYMTENQVLGFDGRVVSTFNGILYEEKLKKKKITFLIEKDLAEVIWEDRPNRPAGKITILSEEIAGVSIADKIEQVKLEIRNADCDGFVLSKLDDIMWLFNIRGCDIPCNPVALSYAYVSTEEIKIFLQKESITEELIVYFEKNQIQIEEYDEIAIFLDNLTENKKIFLDKKNTSYGLYKILNKVHKIVDKKNPTEILKAKKNPVEIENMRNVFLKDSVAVTKFIYWLKNTIKNEVITEISAADYLEKLRREIPEFLDLSFPTISAYKGNAAMMHYKATEESHSVLKNEGMLLVDSGGQYLGGTTDITRTIVLGKISDEIKQHYTLVVAGMLQLSNAKWLYGCSGRNLDILARQPLWNLGIDYKCGTGHGIGYILNVHEGPQNIRWKYSDGMEEAIIESGMDISNEPGVYVEGSHGIRVENIMISQNCEKNEYGQFMCFETLTYTPIDLEAIDVEYLTNTQKKYLNEYHRQVFDKVSPFLNDNEKEWLNYSTREI